MITLDIGKVGPESEGLSSRDREMMEIKKGGGKKKPEGRFEWVNEMDVEELKQRLVKVNTIIERYHDVVPGTDEEGYKKDEEALKLVIEARLVQLGVPPDFAAQAQREGQEKAREAEDWEKNVYPNQADEFNARMEKKFAEEGPIPDYDPRKRKRK